MEWNKNRSCSDPCGKQYRDAERAAVEPLRGATFPESGFFGHADRLVGVVRKAIAKKRGIVPGLAGLIIVAPAAFLALDETGFRHDDGKPAEKHGREEHSAEDRPPSMTPVQTSVEVRKYYGNDEAT